MEETHQEIQNRNKVSSNLNETNSIQRDDDDNSDENSDEDRTVLLA